VYFIVAQGVGRRRDAARQGFRTEYLKTNAA
jgi:hypothetical protein